MSKKVIFTVDVEGHKGYDPVEHLIIGNVGNRNCGIDLLMDICDRHSVCGVFFVDVAEAFDYGKERIAYVMKHIVNRGHEVGVHIHPDHMADKKRLFLHEYSYQEQYEIINKCTEFYIEVLGSTPKAFRAGKYGANYDTLDILSDLGYKADFSEFYGQKWCGIIPPICGTESIRLQNGLVEIPTMSYNNSFGKLFDRFDKIDAGMPFTEYKYVMNLLKNDNFTDPIVLFAHSFSLLNWRRTPNSPSEKRTETKKLERMFNYVEEDDMLSFSDLDGVVNDIIGCQTKPKINKVKGMKALMYMLPRAVKVAKMRFDIKLQKL